MSSYIDEDEPPYSYSLISGLLSINQIVAYIRNIRIPWFSSSSKIYPDCPTYHYTSNGMICNSQSSETKQDYLNIDHNFHRTYLEGVWRYIMNKKSPDMIIPTDIELGTIIANSCTASALRYNESNDVYTLNMYWLDTVEMNHERFIEVVKIDLIRKPCWKVQKIYLRSGCEITANNTDIEWEHALIHASISINQYMHLRTHNYSHFHIGDAIAQATYQFRSTPAI